MNVSMQGPCVRAQEFGARLVVAFAFALLSAVSPTSGHALSLADAAPGTPNMIGEAFDLDNASLLYREFHKIDRDNNTHDVAYRGEDGQVLVLKRLLGGRSVTTPEFSQVDFRTGGVLIAKRREQQWVFQRGIVANVDDDIAKFAASDQGARTSGSPIRDVVSVDSESVLPDSTELVIDAGFDAFVRAQWNLLEQGQRLQFDFAVPARGRTVRLNIEQVALSNCERNEQYAGTFTQAFPASQARVCFKLDAQGWLARMLLKPIYLTYANESRQLLAYAGLSNIKNNAGEALNVYIRYSYSD